VAGKAKSGRSGYAYTPAFGRAVAPDGAAFIGPRERGPFRFMTQRAARSRAGFEAPSQRRVGGDRHPGA